MRVWFDISNSPHINFFSLLIRDLEEAGHQCLVTARPLANTVQLLELHGIDHAVVGVHYGKNLLRKAFGYPIRIHQLFKYLRAHKPDVAISHSSFHSPPTANLLGCRSIYLNDNEHALGNVPSFICASDILVPEFFDVGRAKRRGAGSRIRRYPGVKEGVYLWRMVEDIGERALANPDARPRVYVRPEPWTAQYYSGDSKFLDALLGPLSREADVTVFPRGAEQARHFERADFDGISVAEEMVDLPELVNTCDLFIGAGGTMTREMAVCGVPTISVYQDDLLDVDRYLIDGGYMVYKPECGLRDVLTLLESSGRSAPRRELLEKGQEAYNLIKAVVLE